MFNDETKIDKDKKKYKENIHKLIIDIYLDNLFVKVKGKLRINSSIQLQRYMSQWKAHIFLTNHNIKILSLTSRDLFRLLTQILAPSSFSKSLANSKLVICPLFELFFEQAREKEVNF